MDYLSRNAVHLIMINMTEGTLIANLRSNKIFYKTDKKEKLIFQGRKDFNDMYIEELRHFLLAIDKNLNVLQDLSQAKSVVALLTKR